MNTRRMERASEAIRETVSTTVLFELRDPRIKNVTVLGAEVSPDLRSAKIFVTIMGDAKSQSLAMHGLNSARGFVQSKIAERLQTKNTPVIKFVLDPSVKKSIAASKAIAEGMASHHESSNNEELLNEDEIEFETDEFDEDDFNPAHSTKPGDDD